LTAQKLGAVRVPKVRHRWFLREVSC